MYSSVSPSTSVLNTTLSAINAAFNGSISPGTRRKVSSITTNGNGVITSIEEGATFGIVAGAGLTSILTPQNGGSTFIGHNVELRLPDVNADATAAGITIYNYPSSITVDSFGRVITATTLSSIAGTQFLPVAAEFSLYNTSGITISGTSTPFANTAKLIPDGITITTVGAGRLVVTATTSVGSSRNTSSSVNLYCKIKGQTQLTQGVTGIFWPTTMDSNTHLYTSSFSDIFTLSAGDTYSVDFFMTTSENINITSRQSSLIVIYNLSG